MVGSGVTPNLVQKLLTRVTLKGIISFVSFETLHPPNMTYLSKRKSLSNRHFSGGEVYGECLPYQSLRIIGPFER